MRDDPLTNETPDASDPSWDGAQRVIDNFQRYGHDMRSAVSDIVGGLRLVDLSRLDPETRTQLERVSAAGDTLASLVEAALLQGVGSQAPETGIPLENLVDGWRKRWMGHATARGAEFDVIFDSGADGRFIFHRTIVDRIVSNIVANALDHADGADVRLTVTDGAEGALVIEVADGGGGFDPDGLPDRMPEGRGLGLKIARELASEIQADLRIGTGPPLGGAVVSLSLPSLVLGPHAIVDQVRPDLSDVAILVAEDNQTNQAILRGMLEGLGAKPVFASDGAEALHALDRARFDIALVDIEMPNINGLDVMRAVRARGDSTATMPLVALTAYVLRDNREAIYAAGADGIIGKPVASAEEFGRMILRYVGRPAGLPEPEDVLRAGTTDPAFGKKMDIARLEDLLSVAGPEDARELLKRLTEDLEKVRATLVSGVANRHVPSIREQTHILIAISGAVGADRLSRLAEVLNIAAKRKRLDDLEALFAPCRQDLDDLIALIAARR